MKVVPFPGLRFPRICSRVVTPVLLPKETSQLLVADYQGSRTTTTHHLQAPSASLPEVDVDDLVRPGLCCALNRAWSANGNNNLTYCTIYIIVCSTPATLHLSLFLHCPLFLAPSPTFLSHGTYKASSTSRQCSRITSDSPAHFDQTKIISSENKKKYRTGPQLQALPAKPHIQSLDHYHFHLDQSTRAPPLYKVQRIGRLEKESAFAWLLVTDFFPSPCLF